MFVKRGVLVGALIAAATVTAAAPAMASPAPLESPTPAATEPVAGGWCNLDPAIALWCLIASPSA
ncbi:hypothetical protein [Nocardia concava]|uniref:hypothetical protein n=1 Tax=Nocardia concava TaxID=257281 RepID=UPI00031D253B|nr:hypothetical protein [Nocardia concava]